MRRSKNTFMRTHEEEQEERGGSYPASVKGGFIVQAETRTLVASFIAGGAKCTCCSSAFLLVVVEKGALAGICVVLVMYLVRVVVCVVLDLFVERCDGVVI